MIAAPTAVPPPPVDMPTPPTPLFVATVVVGVVAAAMVVAALIGWRRSGAPTFLLVLLGGLLCCLNEAPGDIMGMCYFPVGGITIYTMFDRPIPLWVVLAYLAYFGGLTCGSVMLFRSGVSRRAMWFWVGTDLVLNLVLELPFLATKLYTYYGPQPLEIFGMPAPWLTINSVGSMLAAVVIVRHWSFFTGPRALLLLLVPYATYMISWVVSMPYFGTLNADVPQAVRVIGGLVAMALVLYVIDLLIRVGVSASPAPRSVPDEPAQETSVERPAPVAMS